MCTTLIFKEREHESNRNSLYLAESSLLVMASATASYPYRKLGTQGIIKKQTKNHLGTAKSQYESYRDNYTPYFFCHSSFPFYKEHLFLKSSLSLSLSLSLIQEEETKAKGGILRFVHGYKPSNRMSPGLLTSKSRSFSSNSSGASNPLRP